jgi:SPP1 gp7 family putative phage head morphogenesis protein
MARKRYTSPRQSAVNPIKPVGFDGFVVQTYPMTRYLDYTEADWRTASDRLINTGMGQDWDTMVTWMLSSSTLIQTLIDRRLNPVRAVKFTVVDEYGDVNEEWTEAINKEWFKQFVDAAMMAVFQGYSAGVFSPEKNKLERYPIALIDPFNKALKHTPYDTNGHERFEDYSNLFYVEYSSQHQTMLGLFQPISKEYIGIAITLRNWLASGTRHAFPVTQVGYNGDATILQTITNPDGTQEQVQTNQNKEVAQYISRNIDPTVAITTPFHLGNDNKPVYDVEVKQTEHTSTDKAYETYSSYIDKAERRIINLVLGATLTMTEGNSRALGEVHERITSQYTEKDIQWIIGILNNVLKPKINLPEGLSFSYDNTQSLTVDDAKKISDVVNQNGRQLSQDFFTQIGIPENLIEEKSMGGIPTPPVRVEEVKTEEKNFVRRVFEFMTKREKGKEDNTGIICLKAPTLKDEVADEDVNLPGGNKAFIADDIIRKLYDTEKPLPVFVNIPQYRYYANTFKAPLLGQNPLQNLAAPTPIPDDRLIRFMGNIFQFSAAKDVAESAAVNELLQQKLFKNGKKVSFAQFKKEVNKVAGTFREDWLKTEYRTASMASIMNKQWLRIEADKDAMPYWQYLTQNDSRVRPDHALLNGKIFRVDDPSAQRLFPPNGWNCRCYYRQLSQREFNKSGEVIPAQEDIKAMTASDVEQGFAYNPGINGIMPNKDSSYFQVLPNVNRLDYTKYKLEPAGKMMDGAVPVSVSEGLPKALRKLMDRGAILKNNLSGGRFVIPKSLLSTMDVTMALGANLLIETISQPDEMWGHWVDEMNQLSMEGIMLRIGSNALYVVEYKDNEITNAYIARSSAQVDMMRYGALFIK